MAFRSLSGLDGAAYYWSLGREPVPRALEDTVQRESINGHPLAVKQIGSLSEIKSCHILFISKSEGNRLSKL